MLLLLKSGTIIGMECIYLTASQRADVKNFYEVLCNPQTELSALKDTKKALHKYLEKYADRPFAIPEHEAGVKMLLATIADSSDHHRRTELLRVLCTMFYYFDAPEWFYTQMR